MTDKTDIAALREAIRYCSIAREMYGPEFQGAKFKLMKVATPELLSSLLDQLEAERQRAEFLKAESVFPGVMCCSKCGFSRTHINVNAATGTLTAGDSKPEACPNGCGPLWHDTYKNQYNALYDHHKATQAELAALKGDQVPVYGPYSVAFIGPGVWVTVVDELPAELDGKNVWVSCNPLFTAPQKPVVLSFEQWLESKGDNPVGWVREAMKEAYDAAIEATGGIVKDGE